MAKLDAHPYRWAAFWAALVAVVGVTARFLAILLYSSGHQPPIGLYVLFYASFIVAPPAVSALINAVTHSDAVSYFNCIVTALVAFAFYFGMFSLVVRARRDSFSRLAARNAAVIAVSGWAVFLLLRHFLPYTPGTPPHWSVGIAGCVLLFPGVEIVVVLDYLFYPVLQEPIGEFVIKVETWWMIVPLIVNWAFYFGFFAWIARIKRRRALSHKTDATA